MSVEDKKFMDVTTRSVIHKNGHYHLPLPFRDDVCLPDNKEVSVQRAMSLSKRDDAARDEAAGDKAAGDEAAQRRRRQSQRRRRQSQRRRRRKRRRRRLSKDPSSSADPPCQMAVQPPFCTTLWRRVGATDQVGEKGTTVSAKTTDTG